MLIISLKSVPKDGQHSHAHSLLRACLILHGIEYTCDTPLSVGEYGKPSLAEHPEIRFNLTHSDGIAACIVSGHECGIDAEPVKKYRPNVVRRAFSEEEKAALDALASDEERAMLFTRIWTLKEAYVKALGIGISFPLNTVSFSFADGRITASVEDFEFRQYIVDGGKAVVSVCIKK